MPPWGKIRVVDGKWRNLKVTDRHDTILLGNAARVDAADPHYGLAQRIPAGTGIGTGTRNYAPPVTAPGRSDPLRGQGG
jgi:hypothetical protein